MGSSKKHHEDVQGPLKILKRLSPCFYLWIGIIENMTELRPAVCQAAGEQGMLGWLLRRLKVTVPLIDWQGFSICIFWVIASEDKIQGPQKSLKSALCA